MKMKTKVKHTNISEIKRKVDLESEAKISKVNAHRKNDLPLKNDLIIEVKELQEKHKKLEEESKRAVEKLKITNKNLEDSNKKLLEEVKLLKQQVHKGTEMKPHK